VNENLLNYELILGAVARGWCHEVNEKKTMDVDLAIAIAEEVAKHIYDNMEKEYE